MKILLVAATQAEIEPFLSRFSITAGPLERAIGKHLVKVLITGVGMVPTAFSMGKHLSGSSYDLALNAGIAGSFDFSLAIGEVCIVTEDVFSELGAEEGEEFLAFESLGFDGSIQQAMPDPRFPIPASIKKVKALTVNKVHGNELSIAKAIARFNPQIESMEGASFFYACKQTGIACIQIRAISNYVERRNVEKWNIPLAIKNLNDKIIELLET